MVKKLKTLLALGVVTVTTVSTAVPASALTSTTTKTTKYTRKGSIYLCINGKKYKFDLNSNCINKPTTPDTGNDNSDNNTGSDNNSGNNTSDNNTGSDNNSGNNTPDNNTDSDNNSGNNTSDNNTGSDNNSESTSNSFAAYQQEVVNLVNKERAKYGLSPLKSNASLANVATIKSQDMVNKNYFSHTSPTYGSPFDMMKQFGISYRTAGENIAMGQKTPSEVVTAWMNSEGHRANILNANFTEIGIGIAQNSKGQLYWTQMFIG
ncbi:CAP domain-containing protein [Romboutsia sp. 1001713B170207_170306_H8]|uniref:CAP domain-containing protein n=1 Tax=Romboutsia sp. 1001713B170207_170306_H8 TaxID=2787112 RepID=UPI00189A63EB|nr:CAP domain-containing protein [Romboutsia sp. 1001713B170207_170306_H8]